MHFVDVCINSISIPRKDSNTIALSVILAMGGTTNINTLVLVELGLPFLCKHMLGLSHHSNDKTANTTFVTARQVWRLTNLKWQKKEKVVRKKPSSTTIVVWQIIWGYVLASKMIRGKDRITSSEKCVPPWYEIYENRLRFLSNLPGKTVQFLDSQENSTPSRNLAHNSQGSTHLPRPYTQECWCWWGNCFGSSTQHKTKKQRLRTSTTT